MRNTANQYYSLTANGVAWSGAFLPKCGDRSIKSKIEEMTWTSAELGGLSVVSEIGM